MIPAELLFNFIGSCFDNLAEGKNGSSSFNFPDISLLQGVVLFISIFVEIILTIVCLYLINKEIKKSNLPNISPTSRGCANPDLNIYNGEFPHTDVDDKSGPKELKIVSNLITKENNLKEIMKNQN